MMLSFRLAKRIIVLVMLTDAATLTFVSLVQAMTTYEIVATPQTVISNNPFAGAGWTLVYVDNNNDGLYNPQVDSTISFSGTTYTGLGGSPVFNYSGPVLNSPVYDATSSPYTNGVGAPSPEYSFDWQFTDTGPQFSGENGALDSHYFTYTQTDHIVLPVDSDIEAGDWHGGKMAFPFSRQGKTVTMNKVNLPVECGHGDPLHLADTAEGYFID